MFLAASFFNNKTLKPFAKIANNDNQITRFDSISTGFWNLFIASIINKTAIIINVEALTKAAKISALLKPNVLCKEADFLLKHLQYNLQ